MTELRTIVDENDTVIGSASKADIKAYGYAVRIAGTLIARSNGRIVLCKVSPQKEANALKWNITAAGHVDAGETYEQAGLRETTEELGIVLPRASFVGYYSKKKDGKAGAFAKIYSAIYDGDFQPDAKEICDVREFSPAELKALLARRAEDFTWVTYLALLDYMK